MLMPLFAQVASVGSMAILVIILIGIGAIFVAVAKALNAPPLLIQIAWIVFGVIIGIVAIKVILMIAGYG